MSLKSRKFKTLEESKATAIRAHFKERKKTKIEEQVAERRLAQLLKEYATYGRTESFLLQDLLMSKPMNRNLESMFYDSGAFKITAESENDLAERIFMRFRNETSSSERELLKVEKLVKEGLLEIDQKVVAIFENFLDGSPAGSSGLRVVEDPKTGLAFSEAYRCDPEGRGGLRLPTESVTEIKFRDCYYSYEETHWSGFDVETDYSDPSAVFLEGKTFTHEVVRKKDWRAKTKPATLTLICELPGFQTINTLNVHSLGAKPTSIQSILYEFPNGVWNEIEFALQQETDNQIMLFSPISTSKLKIKFIQHTPVYTGNMKVKQRGEQAEVYGDRFEFVIEEIWAQRILYKDVGFFETEPIEVANAVSFSIDEVMVDTAVEQSSPFSTGTVSTDALVDKYFVIKSNRKFNRKIEVIIPAPSRGREEELLALFGNESLINFSPKLTEDYFKVYKDNLELLIGTDYQVSIDNGVSWISSFSSAAIAIYERDVARNRQCRVKILNPVANSIYRASYVKKDKQMLDEGGKVKLVNGRIAFTKEVSSFSGEVSILYVLRSMAGNPFITPLITSYFFVAKGKANA